MYQNTFTIQITTPTYGDLHYKHAQEAEVFYEKEIADKYIKAADFYFTSHPLKAAEIYEKVYKITNENSYYYANKALVIYEQHKSYDKCIELYKKLIEMLDEKHTASLYENLAENYRKNKQFEEAIQSYDKAYLLYKNQQLQENSVQCLIKAGNTAVENFEYTKALIFLEKASEYSDYKNNIVVDTAIIKLYVNGIKQCLEWYSENASKKDTRESRNFNQLIVHYNSNYSNRKGGFLDIVNHFNGWQKKMLLTISERL